MRYTNNYLLGSNNKIPKDDHLRLNPRTLRMKSKTPKASLLRKAGSKNICNIIYSIRTYYTL